MVELIELSAGIMTGGVLVFVVYSFAKDYLNGIRRLT